MQMRETYLVGISGPSGSGKTTIANRLQTLLPDRVTILEADNYFIDFNNLPKLGVWRDWDRPENIKWNQLGDDIMALKSGRSVSSSALNKTSLVKTPLYLESKELIIVEGFLLFWDQTIRDLLDLKVFLDLPEEMILVRRETREGRPDSGYRKQVVLPAYKNYGKNTMNYADLILDATMSIDYIVEKIRLYMNKKLRT